MAHYEHVKSYYFGKSAHVPYRYICGNCGKEVTGRAEISTDNKEVKVSSRHPENLKIRSEDALQADMKSRYELQALVRQRKREVADGNFDLLNKYSKCPYCQADQNWSFRPGRAITFSILAIGGIVLDILLLILYIRQVQRGETDKTFLLAFFFLWLYIAAFGGIAISTIKGMRSTGGQSKQLPEVFFDRLDTPYLDADGEIRTGDSIFFTDQNGNLTELKRKQ